MNKSARMWFVGVVCVVAWLGCANAAELNAPAAEVVSVRKIWDQGQHNAFTDLIRWHGRWWCAFREAVAHVGGDGAIRVLESVDGETWASAALVTEKDVDLRDPKFSLTPQDKLMINCAGSVYLGTRFIKGRQSRVLFSDDGRTWTVPKRVLAEGEWLWRVTWHEGVAYGAAYDNMPKTHGGPRPDEWPIAVYASQDGLAWERIAGLAVPGQPNETTLRFLPNGDMVAMVRREGGDKRGTIGVAAPPFREWTWSPSNYRFGGPNFLAAPDATWIAATRDHTREQPGSNAEVKTMIARLDPTGPLTSLVTLPSGGDCSYAGLAWYDGLLWVSYYSSHEGKSAIYLARVKVR